MFSQSGSSARIVYVVVNGHARLYVVVCVGSHIEFASSNELVNTWRNVEVFISNFIGVCSG